MEISNLYVNADGELCINAGIEMIVTAFGSSIYGDYLVYTPKKSK
jgi:hypothetical protein